MLHGIYCIGHKPIAFHCPVDYLYITPQMIVDSNCLYIPDSFFGEVFNGSFLSEYTQLIGLRDHLLAEQVSSDNYIYIFQYRKFLSIQKPNCDPSINNPWSYPVTPQLAGNFFPNNSTLEMFNNCSIIGPVIKVRSLAHNYAHVHEVEDFTSFLLSLRETIFDSGECDRFSKYDLLIPAPSLGLFRIGFFLEVVDRMINAWSHFYHNFYVQRDGYQRRVGGFLLERLNSYLLLSAINSNKIKNYTQGFQITVSNSQRIELTV